MNTYKNEINKMIISLEEQVAELKKEKPYFPKGRIYVNKHRGGFKFYHAYKSGDQLIRKGIASDKTKIKKLSRKLLVEKTLAMKENDLNLLRKAFAGLSDGDAFASLGAAYREVYEKVVLSNDSFESELLDKAKSTSVYELMVGDEASKMERLMHHIQWSMEVNDDDFRSESKTLVTSQGLRVRSRAEVLIAERLYHYGVPFRYEQKLVLGKDTVHPDFTFEDKNFNEFYLEYCGMMDDHEYMRKFRQKRDLYENNGISSWNKMIYLYSINNDFDMQYLDNCIRNRIIPRL